MYKTTATKLFANANKDSANATQRIKRQRLQLANAKAQITTFLRVTMAEHLEAWLSLDYLCKVYKVILLRLW